MERKKRSTTNLANLRLAPLTTPSSEALVDKQVHTSSYIQGKSAPSTPAILHTPSYTGRDGLSPMPRHKSDLALGAVQPRLSRRKAGSRTKAADDEWLLRASASAHALVAESKGQSWRNQSFIQEYGPNTANQVDEEDYDEGYEELAAQGAAKAPRTPSCWGSRYGSRTTSRRGSRRGSMTDANRPDHGPHDSSYVDDNFFHMQPDFVDEDDREDEETVVGKLTSRASFGLGGLVDKFMSLGMFNDHRDDYDFGADDESEGRHSGNAKLPPPPPPPDEEDESRWKEDVAWLLGIAVRAFF
ncbi:hypothetical protein K470DRAFT_267622 [Piedraia hortae CBS 480.64]|uniref:Uncharacterized protein n=1 Tax=Piedraia hortae CBS 480.64 TaxID=1314780 RepID=A0A6A7C9E8_9PEZI|nr:hypothetical protein K470DRAFT_267622 [Piedraia hortae CBS 480.64]